MKPFCVCVCVCVCAGFCCPRARYKSLPYTSSPSTLTTVSPTCMHAFQFSPLMLRAQHDCRKKLNFFHKVASHPTHLDFSTFLRRGTRQQRFHRKRLVIGDRPLKVRCNQVSRNGKSAAGLSQAANGSCRWGGDRGAKSHSSTRHRLTAYPYFFSDTALRAQDDLRLY